MSDRLIRISSHSSLWEAELGRARLAAEGISACLDNATLVLWFWHYSMAVGGVQLYVPEADAGRAREILVPMQSRAGDAQSPWNCPDCGRRVDGAWEICWNCGTSAHGTPAPPRGAEHAPPEADSRAKGADGSCLLPLAAFALILVLLVTGGFLVAALAWAIFLVSVAWLRRLRDGQGESEAPCEEGGDEPKPDDDPARQSRERPRRMGEAIALRAWRASVFGFFWFPPLLLYSAWLLFRLSRSTLTLGRLGNCRRCGAWTLIIAGSLLFGLILAGLLITSSYEAWYVIRDYFNYSGDWRPGL
jgi:hypothetical protein